MYAPWQKAKQGLKYETPSLPQTYSSIMLHAQEPCLTVVDSVWDNIVDVLLVAAATVVTISEVVAAVVVVAVAATVLGLAAEVVVSVAATVALVLVLGLFPSVVVFGALYVTSSDAVEV